MDFQGETRRQNKETSFRANVFFRSLKLNWISLVSFACNNKLVTPPLPDCPAGVEEILDLKTLPGEINVEMIFYCPEVKLA